MASGVSMAEHERRKLTAILAADVAGYSRLVGADEEGTVRRFRAVRTEVIEPEMTTNHGRLFHTAGDSILIEFASVVDAARCAVAVQHAMAARNVSTAPEKRIEFRIGSHLGDVMVEGDGNLLGDGVNIAARLESIADHGGIALSHAAYDQVRDKLREEFVDRGEKKLKNIARPVRVYSIRLGHPAAIASAENAADAPPRLSILVLPFANLGGDPEQEYFVDGVTESLTTDLSRIAGSFVIARNTAFTYKSKRIDVKQIGREMNVRYLLEGSVQRGGSRLRVNVQLVDAESGNQLWAERFDKPVADLFDMQDEIVTRLAGTLNTQLIAAEARRAERSPHPDSMDLYFQGMARTNKGLTPEYMTQAREFFERALALDPGNIEALVGVAMVDTMFGGSFFTPDRAARLAAAEKALNHALNLAPEHARAHMYSGMVKMWTNRAVDGIAECERALTLDRNLVNAHVSIGLGKIFDGRGGETEQHIQEALRLSPRDTVAYLFIFVAGNGMIYSGRYEEAAAWLRRAIETNRNFPLAHFYLAAALVELGKMDEARNALAAGFTFDPKFTIRGFRAGAASSNSNYLAQREHLIAAFRQLGVPEG
ncbi:MAG: adenylate/guanylate cyclase domain-containing protein [Stellaceae bacterium]